MKRSIKLLFLLGMCVMSASIAFAQNNQEIKLQTGSTIGEPDGGRSLDEYVPTAYLNGTTVTIEFPTSVPSQVFICNVDDINWTYSAQYTANTLITIDLSTYPAGTYEICVYAYGKQWWGEFELEE